MSDSALRYFNLWLALGAAAVLAVLVACLVPNPPSPGVSHFDKLEHGLTMTALTVWFASLFPRRALTVAVAVVAYGALIELLQFTVVYRDPNVSDWLADCAGAGLGLLLLGVNPRAWLVRADAYLASLSVR